MNNLFLIPANAKKSLLYFGILNKFDAILFGSGCLLTLLFVMTFPTGELFWSIMAILPAAICALLVFPIPNYHNVRTVVMNASEFYTTRQKYIWKGWCFNDGEREKK